MFSLNHSFILNRFLVGISLATLFSASAQAVTQCRSDVDGNGIVNRGDLQFVLDNWGTTNPLSNLNGVGVTDGADLGIVLAEWGSFCGLPNCPADLNRDAYVDGADIDLLVTSWTSQGSQPSAADLNRDGFVDGVDLGMLLAAFGPCDFDNCTQRAMLSADPKSAALIFGRLTPPKYPGSSNPQFPTRGFGSKSTPKN